MNLYDKKTKHNKQTKKKTLQLLNFRVSWERANIPFFQASCDITTETWNRVLGNNFCLSHIPDFPDLDKHWYILSQCGYRQRYTFFTAERKYNIAYFKKKKKNHKQAVTKSQDLWYTILCYCIKNVILWCYQNIVHIELKVLHLFDQERIEMWKFDYRKNEEYCNIYCTGSNSNYIGLQVYYFSISEWIQMTKNVSITIK